jgi:membrane protein implicated in regulation of membrane protease activity
VVEVFAGHCVALVAGLDLVFGEFFAASFDVAVFGSGKATCAVGYFASYPRYPMRVSYVGFAYGAVHSARRNKFSGKFVRCH